MSIWTGNYCNCRRFIQRFYFQWNKAGMQLTVAKWQTHLCSWIIFYYKRSSLCLIIQGLQLQKPQKEDVLQKKLWTKAIGKIIYGLSIVWHLLYCFGNDIKYNFCSHIKKTKTLAFLIKIHNFVRKSGFLSFCLNKFLIELIYFEEDQKQ